MDNDLLSNLHQEKSKIELNELLKAVFNNVMSGVEVLEAVQDENKKIIDFKYVLVNNTRKERIGKDRLEGASLLTTDPIAANTGLFKKLVAVVEKDETLDDVLHFQYDGVDKWFHVKAQRYNHGLVLSREEITEKKNADGKISELNRTLSARNRELEALTAELKTFNKIAANDYAESLRNLYTSLELIISQDAKNLSDTGKAHIRRAQSTIQKIKLLTEDVIAYSNIQSDGEAVPVNLDEIMAATIHNLQKKIKEAGASVNCGPLPLIEGYPPLLTLLFTHLIENGLKFRKEGNHHQVKIKSTRADAASITHPSAQKDIAYNAISIDDNGIGFDHEHKDKIFDIFFRPDRKSKQNGSGIGLSICKKIMEIHGGFIAAECDPDCTVFHCYFPVI